MSVNTDEDGDEASDEPTGGTRTHAIPADDAFERLGDETRIAVLRALRGDGDADRVLTFSELHEAVGTPTSAGFAYHLRKLTDHYVEGTDDGYRLTYAGRRVARAVVAGTYTERTDIGGVEVEDACPVCGERALAARCSDNVVTIECSEHDGAVATLPLPPGGHRRTVGEDLLSTLDRHHRHRVGIMADGICPECAGRVTGELSTVPAPEVDDGPDERPIDDGSTVDEPANGADEVAGTDEPTDGTDETDGTAGERAQFGFECEDCGRALRSPVAFAVVEYPAIVGFCHDHGIDVRERPLWNLGEEWSETVLSTDPWCVRVSVRLDGDRLDVLVGEGPTIRVLDGSEAVERSDAAGQSSAASNSS